MIPQRDTKRQSDHEAEREPALRVALVEELDAVPTELERALDDDPPSSGAPATKRAMKAARRAKETVVEEPDAVRHRFDGARVVVEEAASSVRDQVEEVVDDVADRVSVAGSTDDDERRSWAAAPIQGKRRWAFGLGFVIGHGPLRSVRWALRAGAVHLANTLLDADEPLGENEALS